MEDYAAFTMLCRVFDPSALLGEVDAEYTINLTLQSFVKSEYVHTHTHARTHAHTHTHTHTAPLPLSLTPSLHSSPPQLPRISVTYRQRPEEHFTTPPDTAATGSGSGSSSLVKSPDKDRFLSLNKMNNTIKTLLRRNTHSPTHHHSTRSSTRAGEKEIAQSPRIPSFQSYLLASQEHKNEEERQQQQQQEQRKRREKVKSRSSAVEPRDEGEEEEEEEEAEGGRISGQRRAKGHHLDSGDSRRPSSEGESDNTGDLGSGFIARGSVSHHHSSSSRHYGRGDSFGRNMRPSYGMLKRSGSSDTFSSQSTLVQRPSFYEDPSIGLMDYISDKIGGQNSLTQDRIRAHTRFEAKKQRQRRSVDGHEMYREEDFSALGKAPLSRSRRSGPDGNGSSSSSSGREGGRAETRQIDPVVGGGGGGGGGDSREEVSIASDVEVQTAIDLLSRSGSAYGDYDYNQSRDEGEFPPYPAPRYNNYSSDYGGGASGYREWPDEGREEGQQQSRPQSENSSSGSSGIDDAFARQPQERSRSASAASYSNGHQGEGAAALSQRQQATEATSGEKRSMDGHESERGKPYTGSKASIASVDSGIHGVITNSKLKADKRERGLPLGASSNAPPPVGTPSSVPLNPASERELLAKGNRTSQELALDFSKGFGPLIKSEPEQFGMDMLRGDMRYQLGLELYKNLSDSDSEQSALSR